MFNSNFKLIEDSIEFIQDSQYETGFLRVKAQATRVGVQHYPQWNETHLRLPEEVFKEDSIETLKHIPITVMHPKGGRVNSNNSKEVQIGFTTDKVKKINDEGVDFVEVEMIITDSITINQVRNKKLTEVSAGYDAFEEKKAGIFDSIRYDLIQRNIRYNHIALLPPMTARAGRKAKIKLDSFFTDFNDEQNNNNNNNQKGVNMGKININGVDFEVSEQVEQAWTSKAKNDSDELVSVKSQLDVKTKETDLLKGKCDSLENQLKNAPNVKESTKKMLNLILTAKSLVKDPSKIILDMSDIEIYKAVVSERLPEIKLDSCNEDNIIGMFQTLKPLDNNKSKNDNLFKSINDSLQNRDKKPEETDNKTINDSNILKGAKKMMDNIRNMKIS